MGVDDGKQTWCTWCIQWVTAETFQEHKAWHVANAIHGPSCPRAGKGRDLLSVATGLLQPCTCGLT